MNINNICASYFSGFSELDNYKKNNTKTNTLSTLKCLSCVLLFPLTTVMGITYGASLYRRRITQKSNTSHMEMRIDQQAQKRLQLSKIPPSFTFKT